MDKPTNFSADGNLKLLALTVFFVTTLPLARFDIGPIPFYLVDGLVAISLIKAIKIPVIHWEGYAKKIVKVSWLYLFFICLSEIRGLIFYKFVFPAFFMIWRYGLGICLVLILPRLINSKDEFNILLKVLVIAMTISASLSIMSSLPLTRQLVANKIFSIKMLNYAGSRDIERRAEFRGHEEATRGRALIGATNITGGFLCSLWPLSFIAYRRFHSKWKKFALLASIITPFGALATYSRTAWLSISLIALAVGLFGYTGKRRIILFAAALAIIIVNLVGIESKSLFVGRIVKRTTIAINSPTTSGSEAERFLSYTQPFYHLFENPIWFVTGAGSAGYKIALRGGVDRLLYQRGPLATHSAFSVSYYNFGLGGAICQLLLMVFSILMILGSIKKFKRIRSDKSVIWETLLTIWVGMTPWWLFTPNVGQMPRGSMFFFLILSIFLTVEKLHRYEKFE